jgi:hypothetical protein
MAVGRWWSCWVSSVECVKSGSEEKTLHVLSYSDIWSVWFSEAVVVRVKIRCQETDSGDCNRLRTVVLAAVSCSVEISGSAVLDCSSEWFIWGVNKSNHPIHTPSRSHTPEQVTIWQCEIITNSMRHCHTVQQTNIFYSGFMWNSPMDIALQHIDSTASNSSFISVVKFKFQLS